MDNKDDDEDGIEQFYFQVYLLLIPMSILFTIGMFIVGSIILLHGSTRIHNRMFSSVLHTSMRFFESNPIGRILNRFSRDQMVVDDKLPGLLLRIIMYLSIDLNVLVVAVLSNVWLSIPAIGIVIITALLSFFHLPSYFALSRLQSTTLSRVFSHLTAVCDGKIFIRLMDKQKMVTEKAYDVVDNQARMAMTVIALNCWLAIAATVCFTALIPCVLILILAFPQKASAVTCLLSLVYAINACQQFGSTFYWYAESQNAMVSTQRIIEYGNLKGEDEDEDEDGAKEEEEDEEVGDNTSISNITTATATDPALPHISFVSFSFRYRAHLPLVLRSVSFSILAGEKIGIVGRTGAGKSTLFLCLCRLMSATSATSGDILIRGTSIFSLPLHSLRNMFCVIPQQPVLFDGETVRFNVDPFGVQGEEEVEEGMRMVGLGGMGGRRRFAAASDGGNQAMRIESGNVSDGEAQLICICRVVLMARRKENAILLIDEATANIDDRTDRVIQEVVREEFKSNTVLTIAHRVQTVMRADRIMIIRKGEVVGVGAPERMREGNQGFREMVSQMEGKK